MNCKYCARSSGIYSAEPCCRARMKKDQERYQVELEVIRILAMANLEDRRKAINGF